MVTILSSTEFENVWNTIMQFSESDPDYLNTHFGVGVGFHHDQIEKNKNGGWDKLREIINDIEERCVVYYYCQMDNCGKLVYFIVFGDDAINEVPKISIHLRKMAFGTDTPLESEKQKIKNYEDGTDGKIDTVAADCPLF